MFFSRDVSVTSTLITKTPDTDFGYVFLGREVLDTSIGKKHS